jgi:hypothetical protein
MSQTQNPFEKHLQNLIECRQILREKFPADAPDSPLDATSESTISMLWDLLYDSLIGAEDSDALAKLGALAARLYSAVTDRRALELKTARPESTTSSPLDRTALSDLEARLKLL